jgi:hypothetical protein
MTEPIDPPPDFERLADLLCEQLAAARDLFRYALVLAMIDDGKAHITGTRIDGDREYLTVQTIAGEVFEIMQPLISDEVEAELNNHVRAIIREDSGEWQETRDKPRPLWSEGWATES